jgi:hypothetical protein
MRFPNVLKAGAAGLLVASMAHAVYAANAREAGPGESPCGGFARNGITNLHMERSRFGKALADAIGGKSAVAVATVREVIDAPTAAGEGRAGASQQIVLGVDEWIVAEARENPPSITVKRFGLQRYEEPNRIGGISRAARPAQGMRLLVFVRSEGESWTVDHVFEDPAAVPAARAGFAFHERFSAGTATAPEDLSDEYFARFYDTYLTEAARSQVELHVRLLLDYYPRARAYDRSAVGFALARYLQSKGGLRPETRSAVEAAIVREATGDDACAGSMAIKVLDWAMTAGGLDVAPYLDAGALEKLAANYRAYFRLGANVPRLPAIDRVLSTQPDGLQPRTAN